MDFPAEPVLQLSSGSKTGWACAHCGKHGEVCTNDATRRIQFSADHPFDHVDLCETHFIEYSGYVWVQSLLPN
jgi:hypothetical protein